MMTGASITSATGKFSRPGFAGTEMSTQGGELNAAKLDTDLPMWR